MAGEPLNNSVLELLKDERIFYIEVREGKAVFIENCDSYFECCLNTSQLNALIEELKSIRSQLSE